MNKSIKRPIKAAFKDLKYGFNLAFYSLSRKNRKKKPLIRYCENGSVSPDYDRPVCLFCNYDKESVIRDHVYHYLNALVLAG
ncbi:MAG: lipopolysaccharide biosynthesis protein, partial [Nitrosospira sp.]|nr:lipopolysaccharide biosynthesis protein [Nitrosospira sp.]